MSDDINLTIKQGKTFTKVVRVEINPLIYVPITDIENSAPIEIEASSHGIPEGWRAAVLDARGMRQINAEERPPMGCDWHRVTVVNANRIAFNDVSALGFDEYTGSGTLVFYTPQPMVGYTVRMQIKDRIGGTVLEDLTMDADELAIDVDLHTITIDLPAETTAAYTWRRGVYDLELVSPTGIVLLVMKGNVYLQREVTTPL